MNRGVFVLLGLLALGAVPQIKAAIATEIAPAPETISQQPSLAQVEPPGTTRPVGTVDPDEPIQIQITNVSKIEATVGAVLLEPPSDVRFAAPGELINFGRLHTSFLPPPLELEIYANEPETSIDALTIYIRDNAINITVAAEAGVSGATRSVRVSESGDVFLY